MSLEGKDSRFLSRRQTVDARELFCVSAIYVHGRRERLSVVRWRSSWEQRKPIQPVPTLRRAFRSIAFPTDACRRGTSAQKPCCSCSAATISSRSVPPVPITAEGLVVGDTVRCPWHHACFSLKTGEALHAPAFSPLACWKIERRDDRIFVQDKKELLEPHRAARAAPGGSPAKIVIVGGGAAGFAAAEKLRRERYEGDLVMVSGEEVPPVDRPNLSKDYLAGKAPEEWIPLRPDSFYSENGIDLRLGTNATGIDA